MFQPHTFTPPTPSEADRNAMLDLLGQAARSARRHDAWVFHKDIREALMSTSGFVVHSEVGIYYPQGRRGRLDLMLTWPFVVAIELDREAPRAKSVLKLRQVRGLRVSILREPSTVLEVPGLDAVIHAAG